MCTVQAKVSLGIFSCCVCVCIAKFQSFAIAATRFISKVIFIVKKTRITMHFIPIRIRVAFFHYWPDDYRLRCRSLVFRHEIMKCDYNIKLKTECTLKPFMKIEMLWYARAFQRRAHICFCLQVVYCALYTFVMCFYFV